MGSDVFFALGQVKRWQGALDVDALFYGSVGWLYKLIPKLVLPNKDQRHWIHGIHAAVKHEPDFFQCFAL